MKPGFTFIDGDGAILFFLFYQGNRTTIFKNTDFREMKSQRSFKLPFIVDFLEYVNEVLYVGVLGELFGLKIDNLLREYF